MPIGRPQPLSLLGKKPAGENESELLQRQPTVDNHTNMNRLLGMTRYVRITRIRGKKKQKDQIDQRQQS